MKKDKKRNEFFDTDDNNMPFIRRLIIYIDITFVAFMLTILVYGCIKSYKLGHIAGKYFGNEYYESNYDKIQRNK